MKDHDYFGFNQQESFRTTRIRRSLEVRIYIYTGIVCFLAQATSPNDLNVNGVEQRLLELNRQSAAARGRLLELIEQQKESVSSKASPSVSPISHRSTVSPQTAGTAGQPDMSLLSCG